jgi:hypothetical protein
MQLEKKVGPWSSTKQQNNLNLYCRQLTWRILVYIGRWPSVGIQEWDKRQMNLDFRKASNLTLYIIKNRHSSTPCTATPWKLSQQTAWVHRPPCTATPWQLLQHTAWVHRPPCTATPWKLLQFNSWVLYLLTQQHLLLAASLSEIRPYFHHAWSALVKFTMWTYTYGRRTKHRCMQMLA